jgi:hypothetical protein
MVRLSLRDPQAISAAINARKSQAVRARQGFAWKILQMACEICAMGRTGPLPGQVLRTPGRGTVASIKALPANKRRRR